MNKFFVALWLLFFPFLVMADSTNGTSLSLTPPSSDYSVMFLGNLFGIVDGVLHGTGSQMMGAIFSVFNSAVLALGGIVIMYTLIVGTMNTAHEGEMLGHKWSSIWIPVRSTAGLALLIPKASGYCLMQIFVMWVVVQGVGAADKVWGAALDYLNRGGVIIQASMDPAKSVTADSGKIAQGASSILASEVCTLGLQKQLESTREAYLALASLTPSLGPCGPDKETNGMKYFCSTPIPDLLATVDAPSFQTAQTGADGKAPTPLSMPVPYFENSTSPYAFLSGICGKITWNPLSISDEKTRWVTSRTTGLFGQTSFIVHKRPRRDTQNPDYQAPDSVSAEAQMVSLTRAAAVQQMYSDLQPVAQNMVNNDPQIVKPSDQLTNPSPACPQANNVFGVPYSGTSGTPCVANSTDCTLWQGGFVCPSSTASNKAGVPIFSGTEFQSSIADYNGVMMPTLNLNAQRNTVDSGIQSKAFIANAKTQGWLSAGSYFFDLVKLNGSATPSKVLTDTDSGLNGSTVGDKLSNAFNTGDNSCNADSEYATLCIWLKAGDGSVTKAAEKINAINTLLGSTQPSFSPGDAAVTGEAASTVYGFVSNSMTLQLPGQPALKGLNVNVSLFPKIAPSNTKFKFPRAACGGLRFMGRNICIGRPIMQGLLDMLKGFSDTFINVLAPMINNYILIIISIPIAVLQETFVTGVGYISQHPGDNPIVILAKMGVYYINAPANLYIAMILQSMAAAFIPLFGPLILGIMIIFLGLASPIIISWMGVMLTVGFATAFYIPLLPYMIFTFGVIAWLTAVIEAMAAAPIVALAITHPEGEGILGSKGETALMILMNVFLRPAMMIIGYIAAIALCYVSVWIINTGFSHVIEFINSSIYVGWAGLYVLFFSVVIYTTMYVTVVQKAFNLIYMLPDHVLRWIGGHPEQIGQEAAGWAGETQKQVDKAGEASEKGQSGVLEKSVSEVKKGLDAINKAKGGESVSASGGGGGGGGGGGATPEPPMPGKD